MSRRTSRWLLAPLGLVIVLGLVACERTVRTNDGRPLPPEPRPAPAVPVDAPANALALRVGAKPTDTNGNGYPDQITVEAYLFSLPHKPPVYEDGAFVFSLYRAGELIGPNTETIALWRIEGDIQRRARTRSLFGSCYGMRLNMSDVSTDVYPLIGANLTCRFEPADGREAVETNDIYSIQIGRRGG